MYVNGVTNVHSILQHIYFNMVLVVGLIDILICRKYKQINGYVYKFINRTNRCSRCCIKDSMINSYIFDC